MFWPLFGVRPDPAWTAEPDIVPVQRLHVAPAVRPSAIHDDGASLAAWESLRPLIRLVVGDAPPSVDLHERLARWLSAAYDQAEQKVMPTGDSRFAWATALRGMGVRTMARCRPSLARFDPPSGRTACGRRLCPWCHARRVLVNFRRVAGTEVPPRSRRVGMVVGFRSETFPLHWEGLECDMGGAISHVDQAIARLRESLTTESVAGAVTWGIPDLVWESGRAVAVRVAFRFLAVDVPAGRSFRSWPRGVKRVEFRTVPRGAALSRVLGEAFPVPVGWWHDGEGRPFAGAIAAAVVPTVSRISRSGVLRRPGPPIPAGRSSPFGRWRRLPRVLRERLIFETLEALADNVDIDGPLARAGRRPSIRADGRVISAQPETTDDGLPDGEEGVRGGDRGA